MNCLVIDDRWYDRWLQWASLPFILCCVDCGVGGCFGINPYPSWIKSRWLDQKYVSLTVTPNWEVIGAFFKWRVLKIRLDSLTHHFATFLFCWQNKNSTHHSRRYDTTYVQTTLIWYNTHNTQLLFFILIDRQLFQSLRRHYIPYHTVSYHPYTTYTTLTWIKEVYTKHPCYWHS